MPAVYPSSQNVFVRSHEASGKLTVDFARNIKDFAVNRYAQVVKVPKTAGYYLEMTSEEAGRIVDSDLKNFVWPDGQPAPEGVEGIESFEFKPFECFRYAYSFMLGDITVENATWDIVAQHASIKARQAMTARTQLVITALEGASLDSNHVIDVNSIDSDKWSGSTTTKKTIQKSLEQAAEVILDDTLAAVDPAKDLMLVINSNLAKAISVSQELVDYIKGSPEALAQIRGELPGRNVMYGLPDRLFGFPLVVEPTRKVTTKKGATKSVSQILPSGTSTTTGAYMLSRVGGLLGVAGVPNFSSVVVFAYEEMTVETRRDEDNRRVKGRVVENLCAKLVAPAATVRFIKCQ